ASCLQVHHLYHLWGTKDPIQRLGDLAFFGRWPVAARSSWNQAWRQGKITRLGMGPVAHNGSPGYFGADPLPDGRPRIDQTLDAIVAIIADGAPPASLLEAQDTGQATAAGAAGTPGAPGTPGTPGTTPAGVTGEAGASGAAGTEQADAKHAPG